MGDLLGLIQGHCPEQRRPAVEVADPEIFELDLDERGDPRTRIKGQGKGADQKILGEIEFRLAWTFIAHPPPLHAYKGDRLGHRALTVATLPRISPACRNETSSVDTP